MADLTKPIFVTLGVGEKLTILNVRYFAIWKRGTGSSRFATINAPSSFFTVSDNYNILKADEGNTFTGFKITNVGADVCYIIYY